MPKSIWKTTFNIDELNAQNLPTLANHLGIKFVEKGSDYLKASMPVDHRTVQPMGILHGGASCALAETVGSTSSAMCVDTKGGTYIVGVDINANHLRQVRSGLVTATASPVRIGNKLHVWQILIHDEADQLVCIARLTTMVI